MGGSWPGPTGSPASSGHVPVDLHGPLCGCGGARPPRGVRARASRIARARSKPSARAEAPGSRAVLAASRPESLTARDVAAAEDAGDPAPPGSWTRPGAAFAVAAVGLVNMFNPDLIVVGGSVARGQGERFLGPARRPSPRLASRSPRHASGSSPAALGDDVGLVGAMPARVQAPRRPSA